MQWHIYVRHSYLKCIHIRENLNRYVIASEGRIHKLNRSYAMLQMSTRAWHCVHLHTSCMHVMNVHVHLLVGSYDIFSAGNTTPTRIAANVGEESTGLWKVVKAQLPCLLAITIGLCAVLIGVIAIMIWPTIHQVIPAPISPKSPCESNTLPPTKLNISCIVLLYHLNHLSYYCSGGYCNYDWQSCN